MSNDMLRQLLLLFSREKQAVVPPPTAEAAPLLACKGYEPEVPLPTVQPEPPALVGVQAPAKAAEQVQAQLVLLQRTRKIPATQHPGKILQYWQKEHAKVARTAKPCDGIFSINRSTGRIYTYGELKEASERRMTAFDHMNAWERGKVNELGLNRFKNTYRR